MKILLLSAVEHQSGSALRFRGLAGALARRGHEVHLLEPVPGGAEPETPAGVRREPCPRLPGRPEWQAPLWLLHGLAAVRRVRPDVVHVLKALPNVWVPARAARRQGARIAVDLDDLDYAYYPPGPVRRVIERFFRRAARDADDVTVHNEPLRSLVSELRDTGSAPLFLDQGIEVERFTTCPGAPAGLRERLGLGAGPVILYAGHLGPASDLGPLLPALAAVAARHPGGNLLVVGDGRDRRRLEASAARHLPPGFAVFAGVVPHRDVPGHYALADVAVNYLTDVEANRYRASIKTREALAAGVPVVASRAADNERFAEWVRLVDGGDPGRFAEALLAELDRPDRDRARAGARHLREHGTWDVAVREVAAHWEGLAETDSSVRPVATPSPSPGPAPPAGTDTGEEPAVSIVVAAYRSERTLPRLLAACRAQDHPGPVEIVVVDDGSPDRSGEIARAAGVRVITQENRGPAAARNRGWREARAPVILFTDADCVPRPDWARRLAGALDERCRVATGSYGIANPGRFLAELIHAEIRWRHARFPAEVEFAGSYNLGATREALAAVDGFDESYPAASGEDNDLSYRLRDAGHRIRFVPEALVDHHHPVSLLRYLREQERHGYWRVVLYRRHPSRVTGDDYAGLADLASPPLALLGLACLVAGLLAPSALLGTWLCWALVLLLHADLGVRVARHGRRPALLALVGVGTVRAFARGWGLARGLGALLLRGGSGP